ncbi:TPA: hypothetical protein J1Z64_003833 [Escherichia coli]|nr:hypothetical protein [Escherichia coli]EIM3170853.1 hypothetical protein [Escherichia coli]EJQ8079263.1 hypothetical protein [Escherichia coli]HAZ3576684.1 hypothetical protein [Escherichia coli]HBA7949948.1 hypothetical protein [Escherichia coli]
MSENWMRHFELLLVDDKGDGIKFQDLKVVFTIRKMPATIFNGFVGDFRLYNLSQETRNRILQKEFTRIQVIAGYRGFPDASGNYPDANVGMIFNGDIRYTITGKDNATDTWVLLQCIDGWEGHLNASVKTTVAAGWKYNELFSLAMKSYAPYGISSGTVPAMPETVFPRGRVVYQNTAGLMNNIAGQCRADWWYENNQVNILPEKRYLDTATVLNADTGLIGMPQQTLGAGVNVRCLINPRIRLGGLIRLDQQSVYRAALSDEQTAQSAGRLSETENNGNLYVGGLTGAQPASINTDGDYIVGRIDYTGDTRGQAWYMDLLCLAKGNADLLNAAGLDASQYL